MELQAARGRRSPTRRIKSGTGRFLAEVGYGPVAEIHGRPTAATGAPPGAVVDDWPVAFVDGMRALDGDGRTQLLPGEGLLLGLEPGAPLWWIAGDDLADAFDRAVAERRAVVIDDPAHVRAVVLPAEAAQRDAALARLRTRARG